MSSQPAVSEKNNKKMLPAKAAAALVGYTPDYVGRLAREEKITATQVGRQWLVDAESLKLFSLQADADKRERQQLLRKQRVAERASEESVAATTARLQKADHHSKLALLETTAIGLCVALFGVLSWNVSESEMNLQALSYGAGVSFEKIVDRLDWGWLHLGNKKTEKNLSSSEATSAASGLVVMDSGVTQAELNAVRASFSDEVSVDFVGDDTGIITPVFASTSTSSDSYRFLLVPVNTQQP